jgi:Rieske Fe-S protein
VLLRSLGAVGATTLAIGGIAALFKGTYRSRKAVLGSASGRPSGNGPAPAATQAQAAPGASLPSGAVKLGASNQLPPGQSVVYTDAGDGQPDILIRQSDGTLTALSAVCTHQGCTVGYEGGQIVCPCHGGVFNARTGAVEGGPPPEPLAQRRVLEQGGEIYALPA